MSEYGAITFEYEPDREPLLKPGATVGWVVVGAHEVGAEILVAEAVALVDDDGNAFIDLGEFRESTVVDTPPTTPGS